MADALVLVESNTTGTGRLFGLRARALGLTPVVLCADPARYPYTAELGIDTARCDTDRVESVLAACTDLARRHRVVGVTTSSEYFTVVASRVAHTLGLTAESPDAVAAARDKSIQRSRFAAHGVDSPRHRRVTTVAEAVSVARAIGFPVVLKPIARSGSLGVRRCDRASQVAEHAALLCATTVDERGRRLSPGLLVESYLDGPEFSVEVLAGRARAVVAKCVDESVGFLETGHHVPAVVDPATDAALRHAALAAISALGLRVGAAHVELRMVAGRAVVVEVNPRLAGGMIPEAIRAATGVDLIGEFVARAAGRSPLPAPPARARHAHVRFLVGDRGGTITAVPDESAVAEVAARDGVVSVRVTAGLGCTAPREGSYRDRLGHVITVGESAGRAASRADDAVRALPVRIEPRDEEPIP